MAEKPVVTCPLCEKKFKPKADVRGKKILCPFCDQSFVVPADGSTAIQEKDKPAGAPAAAKQSAAIPLVGDDGQVENDNPYGVTHLDTDPRCPNCTEKMEPRDAVVCLNCGYNTLTREWGKTEKTLGVSFGAHFTYLLPGLFAMFFLILWMLMQMILACYWPYWVAGVTWLEWTDHESLRMWSMTVALGAWFSLARIAYRRFIVKPIPDEIALEKLQ